MQPSGLEDRTMKSRPHPLATSGLRWLAGIWIAASLLTGSILLSFHVPFRAPASGILRLVPQMHPGQPRLLHILSGGCGCSQKIMQHLAARDPQPGVEEQVLILDPARIDGEQGRRQIGSLAGYLPGSLALLHLLESRGFAVIHLSADQLPADAGLRGVPLLVAASARGEVTYLGGYGPAGDEDARLLRTGFSTANLKAEAIFGCAVGARLQEKTDPFRLKYRRD